MENVAANHVGKSTQVKIIEKHGILRSKRRLIKPKTIILHHTAGGSLVGAERTLKQRGLAYHYMIDKNGDIYEYVPAHLWCSHAYRNNKGTVGISFVGGGKFGPVNEHQIESCVDLCQHLKEIHSSIEELTGHKHIDPRGWKIDPRFFGEPQNGVNWEIDKMYMVSMARACGLTVHLPGYKKIS